MKKNHFYRIALLFLMCQLAMLWVSAQAKKIVVTNKPATPTTTAVANSTTTTVINATLQGVPVFQCTSINWPPSTAVVTSPSNPGNAVGSKKPAVSIPTATMSKNPDNTDQLLSQLISNGTVVPSASISQYTKSAKGQLSLTSTIQLTNVMITAQTVNADKTISYQFRYATIVKN